MEINDNNPYEVLDLPLNADKKTIEKAFAKKIRGSKKHLVSSAYAILRKPEERIIADALTLPFAVQQADNSEREEIIDWLSLLDLAAVYQEDLQHFTEAVVHHFFNEMAEPRANVEMKMNADFDGLREFETKWLK